MGPVFFFSTIAATLAVFTSLPELRKWQRRQLILHKLKLITDALEQAEERLIRLQERHDKILLHLNSNYFPSLAMAHALSASQQAMDEALHFSASLQSLHLKLLTSYPPSSPLSDPY
ncbi:hypothetical protein IHE45_19G177600 [Dioscorea alata]|uniref:Uncharacterized protein n=1 Tax=Dioscorea alata TaxID=55571 RepID=A0ACB7U402_DIOAL|nr:hypothetical protein IHE45_19G177600 [Dioscorea alata]